MSRTRSNINRTTSDHLVVICGSYPICVGREQHKTEAELGTMKHNGASCTVESAPCHCLLDGSRSTSNRSQTSTHDPTWASNSSVVSVSASAVPRNRANGAVSAWCSSPECLASWAEVTERQVQGVLAKVLVTGGAGYFGFRLGRTLASQGVKVVLLDLLKPPWDIPEGAVFYQVNVIWRFLV